ncbi:TFIIB-type zinc finger domain-containing protein [Salipaludibacillus sp. HK11]
MYVSDECKNCGRVRVELIDGKKICEKCHFNQDTNDYEIDYRK